jgi:hypothetical protein
MPSPEHAGIGAHTLAGNRYGSLNQDHIEVWRGSQAGAAHAPCSAGAAAQPHDSVPELLIGAVLDGHGLLGEAAAARGGAAIVQELRRLLAAWGRRKSSSGGGASVGTQEGGIAAAAAAEPAPKQGGADAGSSSDSDCGGSGSGSGAEGGGRKPGGAAAAAAEPPLPTRPLASISPLELEAIVDAAFSQAHASALALYDDPPRVACYPDARTGAASVYCLQSRDGLPVYSAPAGSRQAAVCRPLECGATCTVALLQGRRLVVGNVGDSSAVLGRCGCGGRRGAAAGRAEASLAGL